MTFLNQSQIATIVSLLTVVSMPAIAEPSQREIAEGVAVAKQVHRTQLIVQSPSEVIAMPGGSPIAHNVEVSKDVAATFHIEPNHNPQANQPTTAWFALTVRGGNSIPLSQCNCTLRVYALPRTDDVKPLLQPTVIPLNVEKYREIPGAKITFPQVGAYELEISGTAKDKSFSPFKLTYTVNVIL